jgi:hypothetical protein
MRCLDARPLGRVESIAAPLPDTDLMIVARGADKEDHAAAA